MIFFRQFSSPLALFSVSSRFGLIQQMKTLDDGLAEAISSVIWVAPRLQSDIQEIKIVADQVRERDEDGGEIEEHWHYKFAIYSIPRGE